MSGNNYPKRFEILQNDGETLRIRVGELAEGLDKYFVKYCVNDKVQEDTREISKSEILQYTIAESGKHTFSFYENDPGENFDTLPDGIEFYEDNSPVWEQDVFVIKHDPGGLSKERIEKLAQKHAPFVFLHEDERYLPASLEYLLNKDETGKTKDENLKVLLTLKFKNTENISFPYNDLSEVLPYNGEKNSVLDTIGFNIFGLMGGDTKRDILEKRKKDPDNITIYYSYIPNPEKQQQVIISYHFLYAYDSKQEEEGDIKFASHIFDRESINIVFNWDRNNPGEEPKPEYMIYGAHLEGQTMGAVKQDEDDSDKWHDLQKWTCGRVKVMWENVDKINQNHPSVAVAKGSHAPYPAPGHYAVYFLGKTVLVEPAGTGKVLIPQEFNFNDDIKKEFKKNLSL
ncbi:MAG: hypothetical protein SCARUB_01807 [Candidatus Scalindua rubra]|uniref:Uncharacterized protein n=1 Tax=Candidatus Scalindua rubra TaxID=1872076 RepID=A0A1E3XBP2_9BACT|nr:MAG: hypothetical protein SCARUB_01807 [Candidatus Scalindua rubra]